MGGARTGISRGSGKDCDLLRRSGFTEIFWNLQASPTNVPTNQPSLAACGGPAFRLWHGDSWKFRLRLLDRNAAVGNGDRYAQRFDTDADDTAADHRFCGS
jgi:hypothetical protein